MREIILDTETTGIDPAQGHRIVEIGALELLNHLPTGETFHVYINPERDMPKEAEAVHGLSSAFLRDKPLFSAIAASFVEFIQDSPLIIHNASFDLSFINAELGYLKRPVLPAERVVDTLQLARRRHPMGPNSLDALCKRYGIDNSRRTKHGALLDAELLAEVYLELIGGRQTALSLTVAQTATRRITAETRVVTGPRPAALAPRLTDDEKTRHAAMVKTLGVGALWPSE
jgi:DNA polymerase-3 subunit epsilon